MSFQISEFSKDTYISLQGLINKNNGFWRSAKQAKFAPRHMDTRTDADNMEKFFGFRPTENNIVAQVDVYYSFADYGSRSKVPGLFFFELDDLGVVAKYKVGGRGNLRDGWGPDPKKCKLVWERPADAPKPDFAKDYAEMDRAQQEREDFLAARPDLVAGKQTLEGVISSVKTVHTHFSYHGEVSTKIVLELDNGNRVYGTLPSKISGADKGDRIQFNAKLTVSDDDSHFGFYSRPSKAAIIEEIV